MCSAEAPADPHKPPRLRDRAEALWRRCRQAWRPFWFSDRQEASGEAGRVAMPLRTSYFRQAACFAYAFLLVTLASIVWAQHLLEQTLDHHVQEMLATEVRALQLLSGPQAGSGALIQAVEERETAAPRRERVTAIEAADGRLLYGAAELLSHDLCAPAASTCTGWLRARQRMPDGGIHDWMGYAYRLPDGARYVIAYDVLPMLDRIHPAPLAGGIGVFVVLLVSLGVGLYFSLGTVRRIDRIRQAMKAFVQGDPLARVPVAAQKDEFDQLGADVNQALERIARLMEEVRHATNHIAHELRTPLTRLQQRLANIAEAASGDRAVDFELALAEEETQNIQHLFRTVMRISEIETGRCHREISTIDAQALAADLLEYYAGLAEERQLALRTQVDAALVFGGDRALLFQALVNLLDNAVKYAPPGSTITLVARRQHSPSPGQRPIWLGVADEGPGIAAGQRDQAVQRFQRLTRDRGIKGYGLGLALVQAVANLHGGQLALADNSDPALRGAAAKPGRPGLLAWLQLPDLAVAPPATQTSSADA
ncbi:MAG: HAMP domain-containing sensor histidine kinase [Comamonas sp.]